MGSTVKVKVCAKAGELKPAINASRRPPAKTTRA